MATSTSTFGKSTTKTAVAPYEEIPNIPRKGQRIEDIGLFQRKDLKRPSNLKAVFRDIRNHLAGKDESIKKGSNSA